LRRKLKRKNQNIPTYLTVVLIFLFAIAFFICLPAMIICLAAGWTYFEAFYFMIVTFTTVGFGDYSIAEYEWKFGIIFFIYLGYDFRLERNLKQHLDSHGLDRLLARFKKNLKIKLKTRKKISENSPFAILNDIF